MAPIRLEPARPSPKPTAAKRPHVDTPQEALAKSQAQGGVLGLAVNKAKIWMPGHDAYAPVPGHFSPSMGGVDMNAMQPQTTRSTQYGKGEGETTPDQALSLIYTAEGANRIFQEMAKRGIKVGDFDAMEKIWKQAVDRASKLYTARGVRLSPFDMLDVVAPAKDKEKDKPWKGKSYDYVHTTRSIDHIGPETARVALENTLRDLLGRDPSSEEVEDFASRANAIVAAHPTVTTDTHHMKWDPNAHGEGEGDYVEDSATSKQTGGIDTSAMLQTQAEDQAKSSHEYGAYQAATTYANYLFRALASPVG